MFRPKSVVERVQVGRHVGLTTFKACLGDLQLLLQLCRHT
jgi:hypothetical protein